MPTKVALVTGAARGIGLAAATRFLDDGWHVAMLDILGDTLRTAVKALDRAEATLALEADVSRPGGGPGRRAAGASGNSAASMRWSTTRASRCSSRCWT